MWKKLDNRAFIEVASTEMNGAFNYLQRLITNDMSLINNTMLYTFLLNPKGRYLADFFIIPTAAESFILDFHTSLKINLFKRLQAYSIGSKVSIAYKDDYSILVNKTKESLGSATNIFVDPRLKKIGFRALFKGDCKYSIDHDYNANLIKIGVAHEDVFIHEKSLPLEVGGWALNAINFDKGCFVGQELTARTKYKGIIRKHILPFTTNVTCKKDDEIINNKNEIVGKVCVVNKTMENTSLEGLAQIYLKDMKEAYINDSSNKENKLNFTLPDWLKIINPCWD